MDIQIEGKYWAHVTCGSVLKVRTHPPITAARGFGSRLLVADSQVKFDCEEWARDHKNQSSRVERDWTGKKNRCMGERETKKTGKYIYGNELLNALQMCFIKVTDTSVWLKWERQKQSQIGTVTSVQFRQLWHWLYPPLNMELAQSTKRSVFQWTNGHCYETYLNRTT